MANDIQAITGGLDDSDLQRSIKEMVASIEKETKRISGMFEAVSKSASESLDNINKKGKDGATEATRSYAAYKKELADINTQFTQNKIGINEQASAIEKLKNKYSDFFAVASAQGQKLKGTNMGGLSESLTGKISKGNVSESQVANLNISQLTQAQSLVKDIIGAGDINVRQQQKLVDLNATITAELKRQNQASGKSTNQLTELQKMSEYYRELEERQKKYYNSEQSNINNSIQLMQKRRQEIQKELDGIEYNLIGQTEKKKPRAETTETLEYTKLLRQEMQQLQAAETALSNFKLNLGTADVKSHTESLTKTNFELKQMGEYYRQLETESKRTAQAQKEAQAKLLNKETTNLSVVGRMPENDQLQVIEKINRLKEVGSKIRTIDPSQEAALAKINQQVDKLEVKLNRIKQPTLISATNMGEGSISAVTEKINALIRARDRMSKSDDNYRANLRTANNEISRLSKLNQEAATSGINLEKKNNALATSFENLGRRVLFYFTLGAITGFVRDLAEVRGEYELLERSLGAIIGDFGAGTKIFQEQQAQALKSPFTVIDLGNATKQLAAYGFAVDELVPVTKRLADISAGVGVEMSRVIYNIGQIKAKGVLDARDLRDFGNAGINVTKALADMYSTMEQRTVSTGEVFDRVTQRMVSFEDVMSVMNKLTDEGGMFFNMQAIQAETLKGQLSNLKDAYNKMLNEMGSDNQGLLNGAVASIRGLYENWETVVDVITQLIAIYGAYKVTQMTSNALLGAENVALQKNIIVGKQKVAADLMKEMSTRQLTAAEHELIRTQNVLTKSDLDSLIANKNLTAQQLLRLAALGRLTDRQKVAAIQSGVFNTQQTAMLHNMTMGTRRVILFGNAMTAMGVAIKGAISAIVSWNTVFMIVLSLIPNIISKISEHNKLIKEAKEGYAKLNDEITNLSGSYEIEKQNGQLDNQKTKLEQLIKLANEKYQMDINIDVKTMSGEQVDAKFSQITDEIEKIVWGAKQIGVALAGEGGGESLKTFGDTMADTFSEVKNRMNGLVGDMIKNEGQLQSWHKEFIAAVSIGQQEGESTVDFLNRINKQFEIVKSFEKGWEGYAVGKDAQKSAKLFGESLEKYNDELDKAKSKMREVGEQAKESIGKNLSPEELYKAIQLHIKDESLKSEWNDQVKPWILDELKDAFNMRVNIVTQFTKPKETEKTWSERLLAEIGSNTTIKTPYKGQLTQVVKSSEDLADAIVKVSAAHKKAQDATKEVMKSPFATAAEIQAYKEQEAALLQLKNRIDGTPDEEKNRAKAQDKQLEFIKEEITLINNLRKDYDDLTASGKSASDSTNFLRKQYSEAIAKINNTAKALKLKIPPFDISNFAGKTDAEISKALDGLMKSLSSSAARKDLSVELAKLNISAEKYDYTKITDGLTKALSEIDEQFALGKEINESETIGNAFMQMFNIPEEDIIRTSKDAIKRIQEEVTKAIVEFNKKGGTQLPTDFNLMTGDISSLTNLLGDDKNSNDFIKGLTSAKTKQASIAKSDVKETEKAYKDLLKKYSEFEYKRAEIAEQAAKDRLDFAKKFGNEEEIKLVDEKLKAISDLENQLANTSDNAERDTLATQLEAAKAEVTKLLVEMAKLKGIPISIPLTIDKKESADLAKLVYDDFINSDLWVESFENVSNLSTGAIQQMITQLEKLGIENKKSFSVKELKEYYDKLDSLKKSLIEKNPFIGFAKNMKDALKDVVGKSDLDVYKKNNGLVGSDSQVRETAVEKSIELEQAITTERNKGNNASLETLDALEKQLQKQKEIIGYVDEETKKRHELAGQITEFAGNVKDATSVIGDIGNTMFGDKDTKGKEIFNDVLNSINGVATAGEGVAKIMTGHIVEGSIQVIKGLWDATKTWLDNSNNEINRKVEKSKETIDKLQKSYVGLERAVTKAIGSQEIAAQKALISAKKMELAELKKQLALEKSRKEKDKDTARITEIEAQIQSLSYEISDAIDTIANNLLGTDIKSAAEDFAGVWIDAFLAGEDAMDALENKFGDMIKNMIVKAIASEVIASKLQPLWDEIKNLYNDNVISPDEVSRLIAMSKDISGLINEEMTALKPLLDSLNTLYDDSSSKMDKSTLQKGISGVTETTAGIIEGYMNSVRTEVIIHTTLFKEMIMKGDIQMTINSNQLLVLRDSFQVQKSILNLLSAWSASESGGRGMRVYLQN